MTQYLSSRRAFGWLVSGLVGGVVLTLLFSSGVRPVVPPGAIDPEVEVTLLQMNDVYEITPLGDQGGLARVATLKQELKAANPDTYALIAGDLLSPSAVGLARIDDNRLSGKQMVASLNTMGLDYATFGNHEFDILETELSARLQESRFTWFSSNVTRADGNPFPGVPPHVTFDVSQAAGSVRVGMFALTLDSSRGDWVRYDMDLAGVAREQVRLLREDMGASIVIALTHLELRQDILIAESVAGIDLILGGHEHENIQIRRGPHFTPIVKADANARSVYIHHLKYHPGSGALSIESEIRLVTAEIPDEPETARIVDRWMNLAFESFRAEGIHPENQVAVTPVELDGLEASTRNGQTEMTRILVQGMQASFPEAVGALVNSGTIRIDDKIPAGQAVTEYDVLRILPFDNNMVLVSITGELLRNVVEQGDRNHGKGGFLQRSSISKDAKAGWLVAGDALQPEHSYLIVMSDFLLSGREDGLAFLVPTTPGIEIAKKGADLRAAFMQQLRAEANAAETP